jgi:hypothetical protein
MTEFIRGGVFVRTIGIETETKTHSRLTSVGRLTPIIEKESKLERL